MSDGKSVFDSVNALVGYALTTGLIENEDVIYSKNRLLEQLGLESFENENQSSALPRTQVEELEGILKSLLDYASSKGLFNDNGTESRDLFDTKLMSCFVPRPSYVEAEFLKRFKKSSKDATDWFYKFSQDSDYIRRYRICKDVKWKVRTDYGDIDVTINLSKPEKDPREIAAARNAKVSGYPACLLCKENVGYAGHPGHPARQTHRIIPLRLNGREWGLQYSPYVYYNEHCIVFSFEHVPMVICHDSFTSLFDFVKLFPHYTIGSNADLPIVGGSILTHNHFQGGCYEFPMSRADYEETFSISGFDDVKCGIIKWPMSVIRLTGRNSDRIVQLADKILLKWRGYSDKDAFVFAETDGERHNTITPIARRRNGLYEMDLVLRNNITTQEHPLGVFHPHADKHHIKKENIGLIEVMGLAVLPARLKKELSDLARAILQGRDISADPELAKHADWVSDIISRHEKLDKENVGQVLKDETGLVFASVLEDAGVFKRNEAGRSAFRKFIKSFA